MLPHQPDPFFKNRIEERPIPIDFTKAFTDFCIYRKVIFTNKENMENLTGYKARVLLKEGIDLGTKSHVEIHLVITGLSPEAGKQLFEKLKPLPIEEVYGETR